MDRLFLDANVLFSVAYREDSSLLRLWKLQHVELVTSACAFEEARRNLDTERQLDRLQELTRNLRVVPESAVALPEEVMLPEKDLPILEAAIAVDASHLINGDRKDFGPYFGQKLAGVWVMTPREYLSGRES